MDTYSQIPTLLLLADRERTCQDGHDLRGGNGSGALREPSIGHVLVASAGLCGFFSGFQAICNGDRYTSGRE